MSVRQRKRKRARRSGEKRPSFRLRRGVLLGFLGTFLLAVIASTVYRQVIDNEFLQHEGELRYLRASEIPARRGMILDRNGEPLAVSTPVATVWADPSKLVGRPEVVADLAASLETDPKALQQKLEQRRDRFFLYLKRRIGPDQALAVEDVIQRHKLANEIGIESEYRRFYPSGEIFGHVIGFTDIDDRGIEGMELAFDKWLHAEPGRRLIIQDGIIFFRGDGKYRSKIGLSPSRALPYMGSYDAEHKVLTVVFFSKPEEAEKYVNSLWELQEDPFGGDVANSYNDGPVNGEAMGPFYELESSSPAAFLMPDESMTHVHTTIHMQGSENDLDVIAKDLFNVDLASIKNIFI